MTPILSFLEEFMRDRSQINIMTDKHVDRFLTQSPVEQLFRELNQISFKTEKPRNPEYRYRYRYWYR